MSLDEFLSVQRDIEDAARPRRSHPKGWEPGVDTAKGVVVAASDSGDPPSDWSEIIRELGLDPSAWTVDESQPVQVRTWDSGDRRMYYYRATVVPVGNATDVPDIDALIREVKRLKRKPSGTALDNPRAMVICLADWQAGKADGGGAKALAERLFELREAVPARVRELKKLGRPVDQLLIVGLGDLLENCDGHYPMQTWSAELDRREQERFVRRMLTKLLTRWAPLAPRVVVACVPGNHGENRKNGKAFTSFEDNADLAVFDQLQEILAQNEDVFGHVSFVIPSGDMSCTLDVCGTIVAFAHGHQARRGATPQARLLNWWQDKMRSRHPVGDADVLVTGHYHYLQAVQDGPRTWFQAPANDGGSRWFEERGGSSTVCGTLTFVVDGNGWSDLAVL